MKHKHHIIPRHAGGTNHPTNLVELSIEEHAEAHRLLYDKYGRKEDELAWKMLSGQISKQQLQLERSYLGGLKTPKKKVAKYNDFGNLIEIYESVKEAAEKNNSLQEYISDIANFGRMKRHNKFRYRFFDDEPLKNIEKYIHKSGKKIGMYTLKNELIEIFDTTTEASKKTNMPSQNIGQCALGKLKTCGGYIWRYENAVL